MGKVAFGPCAEITGFVLLGCNLVKMRWCDKDSKDLVLGSIVKVSIPFVQAIHLYDCSGHRVD